ETGEAGPLDKWANRALVPKLFFAMRFALLGSHPDGLAMAWAVSQSGRHEVASYSGTATGADFLREHGIPVKSVGDTEEVLADPAIEAVIVGGRLADRP